jgi:hypothetical protein
LNDAAAKRMIFAVFIAFRNKAIAHFCVLTRETESLTRHISRSSKIMKLKNKIVLALGISGIAAMSLLSGCVVRPYGGVAVEAPSAEVTVEATVPDDYVWDGYEYVGVVGDQYYYLGPGNVWIVCDPVRLARFHDYVRVHPDWHGHAIRNDKYRNDSHGHYQPRHDARPPKKDDHDYGH